MNKMVGLYGGHSIYPLGPANDVAAFFKSIDRFVPEALSPGKFDLITDRLFRRYLKQSELDRASQLMDSIKDAFKVSPNKNIDWYKFGVIEDMTTLRLSGNTAADVFETYFDLFLKAKGSAISFFEAFNVYKPVVLAFADLPDFMLDKMRSLAEYDSNDTTPFWLR